MTVKNYQPIWTIDDIIVRLLVHIVSLSNVIQFVPQIKSQPATEIRRRNGQNGPRALKANKLMIVSWIVCLLSFCHFFWNGFNTTVYSCRLVNKSTWSTIIASTNLSAACCCPGRPIVNRKIIRTDLFSPFLHLCFSSRFNRF